jgi:hypothetical protein
LIARGLTNKEIGHSLGITERGVAAQISRLLAKFLVPNRAGLIARVLADHARERPAASISADTSAAAAALASELDAYRGADCSLMFTVGRDHVIAFESQLAARVFGPARGPIGMRLRDRIRGHAGGAWLKQIDAAYHSGVPAAIAIRPTDGEEIHGGVPTPCLVQPLRGGDGDVRALLFIYCCAVRAA